MKPIVEHAKAASEHSPSLARTIEREDAVAAVLLVHDQGVYLMSNGNPRDVIDGTRRFPSIRAIWTRRKAKIERRVHFHALRHAHAAELARECAPLTRGRGGDPRAPVDLPARSSPDG